MTIQISHPAHEHELELKNYQKPYTCDGCKEQGFGSRYRCEQCNFDLHEDCVFTTDITSHDFFEGSTFKFLYETPGKCNKSNCNDDCTRYCDACGKTVRGFVYHCEEEGWDLHPCCLNLKKELSIEDIKFRLRNQVSSRCNWCNHKKLQDSFSDIPGWSYVSQCKKYHFHVYCATEMVHQGWKKGSSNNNCLALENLKLPLQLNKKRNGGGGSKCLKIVTLFLKTIACILLGDPTITLACLLLDIVSN